MDSENVLAQAPEKGTRMKCTKCGRKWTYRGSKRYYACCPDCHTSVRIRTGHGVKLAL